jgi:type VI secretion system VasD/TssJ family lipoprotein
LGAKQRLSFFHIVVLCLSCVLGACAGTPTHPSPGSDVAWSFGPKAIQISYHAARDLNAYDGKAHTILLCFYQLSDPDIFNNLSKSEDGVTKLLNCSRFDKSVVDSTRVIVQPGDEKTIDFDRAENARWVGLAAGYYELNPEMVTRLIAIPVAVQKKWLIVKTPVPGDLSVDLVLGTKQIHRSGSEQ